MEKTDSYRKGSGSSKKWDGGGPGGPGSGPYGGGPRGPPRGMDNVRGIDHSMFTIIFDFRTLHYGIFLILLYPHHSSQEFLLLLNPTIIATAGSLPACGSCCG